MLTNKKYAKFADDNTVEVISQGKIDQAGEDERLQTYKAKDGKEYLLGWPNLTLEELKKLNQTCAKWNDTRGIPYTCVVNPHTLEKMSFISGGYAAGKLMEEVSTAKKALQKQYGKGISRKDLRKIQRDVDKGREELEKNGPVKALAATNKVWKKVEKQPEPLQKLVSDLFEEIFKKAEEELAEAEGMIGRGDKAAAARSLAPLARALKGTRLEERANALLESAKAE